MNKMKEIIFLDGKFIKLKEAGISLVAPAFLYGWSLFETMRAYRKRIVYLREHLKRLKKSSKYLSLKFLYTFEDIEKIICRLTDLNRVEDAYVRLTLFKNIQDRSSLFIWVKSYQPYPESKYQKGFSVCISDFKVAADSFLTRLKSGNYLLYQLSYLKAKRRGFDEAVILNDKGYIAEATRSNIFLIKNNKLFTPSLNCGCLEGITRKVVIDIARSMNLDIKETQLSLEDLYKAEEAFLTNSLMGLMPLTYINNFKIGKNSFELTYFIREKYRSLLFEGERKN